MIEQPSTTSPAGVAGSTKVGNGEIRLQRFGGCVIVRLAGEFGASNVSSLQRSPCDLVNADHVVELSRVAFLDATALHALTHAHNTATKCCTSVQITGARETVRRLLEVTRLDANLNYHDHTADAVEAALTAGEAGGQFFHSGVDYKAVTWFVRKTWSSNRHIASIWRDVGDGFPGFFLWYSPV